MERLVHRMSGKRALRVLLVLPVPAVYRLTNVLLTTEPPMDRTRLSNKGQVVIPARLRHPLGWQAGVEFTVEQIEGGLALRPIGDGAMTAIDEVYGSIAYAGPPKSLHEMEEAIVSAARRAT